jgi:hypothetical protein
MEWLEEFKKKFPAWAKLLTQFPSLKDSIQSWWESEANHEDPYNDLYNGLMAAVQDSSWWQSHSESMRDAQILKATDPATYEANLVTNSKDAQQISMAMGGWSKFRWNTPSEGYTYFDQIAEDAETYGWSAGQIQSRIVRDGMEFETDPSSGKIKQDMDAIEAYARRMVVNIPKSQIRKMAHQLNTTGGMYHDDDPTTERDESKDMFLPSMTWDSVQDYIQGLAVAEYGDVVDVESIAAKGLAIEDLLGDFRSEIANTLEINPEHVDLLGINRDELIKGDGPDGLYFANRQHGENFAKRQSRYQFTDEFRGDVRSLAGGISQIFGLR